MSLLRSSPNLEKITIQVGEIEYMTELQASEMSDISFNHLREVKLVKVYGTQSDLMLIELLLAKPPKLERMFIEPELEAIEDGGLNILKELAQFRRASPLAQITYCN